MTIKTQGTQKETKIIDIPVQKNAVLHYNLEYDSTNPEQVLRDFIGNIRKMISRFEGNQQRLAEIETELVDLEHYIEIVEYQNAPGGYKLYRKLAELRRERRACKNENDLLRPIYEHFHATGVLSKLGLVQGEIAKSREAIDSRVYAVRTDVLDELINPSPGGISSETWHKQYDKSELGSEILKMMEA